MVNLIDDEPKVKQPIQSDVDELPKTPTKKKPSIDIAKAIIILEELKDGLMNVLFNGKTGRIRTIEKVIRILKGDDEQ